MEAGEIGENRENWFALDSGRDEVIHGAEEGRKVLENLSDADDGDLLIIHHDFDSGSAHERATHAEDVNVEALLQRSGELSSIHVAGSFTGGEEEGERGHGLWSVARRLGRRKISGPHGGMRAVAVVQFLVFVLELVETEVDAAEREKFLMGARFETVEDRELVEETMDWERHLILGFLSDKVAGMVSQLFADASKKRWEHIAQRIEHTLKDEEVAMLIIREGHMVQFPQDVEVFIVSPPSLNELHRWLRERQEKAEREELAREEAQEKSTSPAPKTADDLRAELERMEPKSDSNGDTRV